MQPAASLSSPLPSRPHPRSAVPASRLVAWDFIGLKNVNIGPRLPEIRRRFKSLSVVGDYKKFMFRVSAADPWHFGTDPNSRIISSVTFKTQKKLQVFFLITFWRYSDIRDKKSKRGHKTVGIKVLLTILLDDRRIRFRASDLRIWSNQPALKYLLAKETFSWTRLLKTLWNIKFSVNKFVAEGYCKLLLLFWTISQNVSLIVLYYRSVKNCL
jgi:hypothetical protein